MMRGYILQLTFEQDNKKSIVFGYQQELPTDCSSGKIFSQSVYNLYCLPFVCAQCFTMTNFKDLILSLSNHMRVCTLVTNFYWNGCPNCLHFRCLPESGHIVQRQMQLYLINWLHKIWSWLMFNMERYKRSIHNLPYPNPIPGWLYFFGIKIQDYILKVPNLIKISIIK